MKVSISIMGNLPVFNKDDFNELNKLALPYGNVRIMLPPLAMVMGMPFLLLTMMIGGFFPPAVVVMEIFGVMKTEMVVKSLSSC